MASLLRLGIGVLAAALAGCGGPDHEALCEQQVECIGGNDKDLEACVATLDYVEGVSSDVGCSDEYDAYFECRESELECDTQDTQFPCGGNADCDQVGGGSCSDGTCKRKALVVKDEDVCRAEDRAFSRCADVDLN
jgi:hypothetical protein